MEEKQEGLHSTDEGTKVVLQSNMPEEALVIPEGEAGTVTEMKEEGDPMAITHGEKPPFDVMVKTWVDGEPTEDAPEVQIVLAKDKKHYQRGLIEITVPHVADRQMAEGGVAEDVKFTISTDVLLSCIYNVYEVKNPYEAYDPNKPILKAYGMVKEEEVEVPVEEVEGAPKGEVQKGKKRTLLEITMNETELIRLKEKYPEGKPLDLLLAIEEADPHKEEIK